MAALRIRKARLAEQDAAAQLLREAYQQYEPMMPPEPWREYVSDIVDVRGRWGQSELLVAELEGRLVGAVTFYPDGMRSGEGWPPGWAAVRLLAVRPVSRGAGVGRALMAECLRRCRSLGLKTVGLHTTEAMAVAKAMYERMGFVRVPEFDFRPAPGIVVMGYRLDLAPKRRRARASPQ